VTLLPNASVTKIRDSPAKFSEFSRAHQTRWSQRFVACSPSHQDSRTRGSKEHQLGRPPAARPNERISAMVSPMESPLRTPLPEAQL
jgi:hypothetical protein